MRPAGDSQRMRVAVAHGNCTGRQCWRATPTQTAAAATAAAGVATAAAAGPAAASMPGCLLSPPGCYVLLRLTFVAAFAGRRLGVLAEHHSRSCCQWTSGAI
jgi:hypothetical protein